MELRHLRYFTVVAREQNITRAAAKLHVSQPPLSRQIHDLEDELGVRLFERGAKQITLTPAGKSFYRDALKILAAAAAAAKRARDAGGQQAGELRIGYSPTATAGYLSQALKLFRATAPGVRVMLLELSTDEMIAGVETKSLDMAILIRPLGVKWPVFEFKQLFDLAVGVIVTPQHRFAKRKSVTLDEALAEPIVAFTRRGYSDYHAWLARALKLSKLKPRIHPIADGAVSVVAALESGQGIAFAPAELASMYRGRVRCIELSTPIPRIEVGILTCRGRTGLLVDAFHQAAERAVKEKS